MYVRLHYAYTLPALHLHCSYTVLALVCTYTTATYHNIGRWKELSEQPNILPPHTHPPPWHNHKYAWVCKHLVQVGVYTKTTTAYTLENNDYQRVTTKSARCRQNYQTNIQGCASALCAPITHKLHKHQTLPHNATSQCYLKTQALMGATRPASGHFSAASSRVG